MQFRINAILKKLIGPAGNLTQRASRAAFWVFSLRMFNQILYLVRTVVLARLLLPNDFGLMGIALLAMAFLTGFTQTGFNEALIQKKGDVKKYLDVCWTVQTLRGTLLFGIVVALAPVIGSFYESPEVVPILQVVAISFLADGFMNIGIMFFDKELELSKRFIYELSSSVVDFLGCIIAVFFLGSVWALVIGLLAGRVTRLILSYMLHPYRPHFSFRFSKIRGLYGYARWVFVFNGLFLLNSNGADIVLGKLLAAASLGLYQMANRIAFLPASEISGIVGTVAFPTYSKLQDDTTRLGEAYLRTLQLVTVLAVPIAGLIFVLSFDITRLIFGENWISMAPAMQILSVYGLITSISACNGPIWRSVGKPNMLVLLQVIQLVVLAIVLYPLITRWGITGAAIAVLVKTLVGYLVGYPFLVKELKLRFYTILLQLFIPLLSTIAMVMVISFFKDIFPKDFSILYLILLVVLGGAVYTGGILIFIKFFKYKLGENVKKILRANFQPQSVNN